MCVPIPTNESQWDKNTGRYRSIVSQKHIAQAAGLGAVGRHSFLCAQELKADENFRKLAQLFPNAITETIDENGEVIRAIDKDILMQEINTKVVDGKEERYQFTWPDKKKSMLLANQPINKTLRPGVEESVGKDGTKGGFDSENIYIEGDNLEVLKLLQETYLGKIKMIYIDPPYNTGDDFIYKDNFKINAEEWDEQSGDYDVEGNRLVKILTATVVSILSG